MPTEVLIIESRHKDDYAADRKEGDTLQEVLKLMGVKSVYREVKTMKGFQSSIRYASKNDGIKYVHFSCHGQDTGILLTDGTFITWSRFDEIAWKAVQGKHLIFSSCLVANGVHNLFKKRVTFCDGIVAPKREVGWGEALVAYSVFYLKMTQQRTKFISDINVMNKVVSGRKTFLYFPSPSAKDTGPHVLGQL